MKLEEPVTMFISCSLADGRLITSSLSDLFMYQTNLTRGEVK